VKDSTEIIRLTEPIYQQILLKGKNLPVYPRDVLALIKEQDNWMRSDFVWLRQDARDVVRNKNYTIQLLTQVNPDIYLQEEYMLTGFLPGNVHYLLDNKDTIARFSITKNRTFPDKHVFPGIMGNGYDSSQFFIRRDVSSRNSSRSVRYDYVMEGSFRGSSFRILCGGVLNSLKEIYFNNELICIAEGKVSPEKFIVFDASLPNETLNTLLLLAYNQFFP
jgi:hypothetical protein